jgi:hypothetical protein
MTETPDLQQLARRYLDLWQCQMAAQLNDPLVAQAVAQAYLLMTEGMTLLASFAGLPMTDAATRTHDPEAHNTTPSGAASAGAPSDCAGLDVVHLARRVAELEERLLRMEATLAGDRRGTESAAGAGRRRRLSSRP